MTQLTILILSSAGSAVAGFLAGAVAEPVKLFAKDRYELWKLQDNLYREFAENYIALRDFIEGYETRETTFSGERFKRYFLCKVFEHKEEFEHQIENWFPMDRAYGGIIYFLAETQNPDRNWKAKAACKAIEDSFSYSTSKRFIKKIPARYRNNFKSRY